MSFFVAVEDPDDALHLLGKLDDATRVVGPCDRKSADGEVRAADRLDLFDAGFLRSFVEGLDEVAECGKRCRLAEFRPQLFHADDLGKEHRDIGKLAVGFLITLLTLRHRRCGQNVVQQLLILSHLPLQPLGLQLDVFGHLVEHPAEFAEFIARLDPHLHIRFATTQSQRALSERTQGPREQMGKHQCQERDRQCHAARHNQHRATQLVDRRLDLGKVLFGDHCPAQRIKLERPVGTQCFLAAIIIHHHDAFLPAKSSLNAFRLDRHRANHIPLLFDSLDHRCRHAALPEKFEKALGVRVHEARATAHGLVGANEIGLACLAHPLVRPIEIAGQDLVEVVDRKLQHQQTNHLRTIKNRAHRKSHRLAKARTIRLKISDFEIIAVIVATHRSNLRSHQRVGVGTRLKVGRKLAGLLIAVNNFHAFSIDQHHILKSKNLHRTLKGLVVGLVNFGVRGFVRFRFLQILLFAVRMGIVRKVVILQISLGRLYRQVLLEHRLSIDLLVELRKEIVFIKPFEFLRLLLRQRRGIEALVRCAKIPHAIDGHMAVRHGNDLIPQRIEHRLQRRGLGHLHALEVILRRTDQRRSSRLVTVPRHNGDGRQTHCQQQQDHLRLDAQSVQA